MSRQYVSRSNQSQYITQPQAVVSTTHSRKITLKATPSVQQVWVPKGSQPTKLRSHTQPSKTYNSSAPPESVFSRLGQKSVFRRLGSKIPLDIFGVTKVKEIPNYRLI
jgi:hypothetical protein